MIGYLYSTIVGVTPILINQEKRTTHYTGDLTDSISILDDTKILYEKEGDSLRRLRSFAS